MAKTIGHRWKTLSPEEYKRYTDMADVDSARYQEEMDTQVLQTGYFSEEESEDDEDLSRKKSASDSDRPLDQQQVDTTFSNEPPSQAASAIGVVASALLQTDASAATLAQAAASVPLYPGLVLYGYQSVNMPSLSSLRNQPMGLPYLLPPSLLLSQPPILLPSHFPIATWNPPPTALFPPPPVAQLSPLDSIALRYALLQWQRQALDPSTLAAVQHAEPEGRAPDSKAANHQGSDRQASRGPGP